MAVFLNVLENLIYMTMHFTKFLAKSTADVFIIICTRELFIRDLL